MAKVCAFLLPGSGRRAGGRKRVLTLGACSGGGTPLVFRYDPVVTEIPAEDGRGGPEEAFADDGEEGYAEPPGDDAEFQLTGIIETCRHCMGYGIVQDGLYGVPEYCKFCGGQRVVDAAVNQLPDDFFEQTAGQYGGAAPDYGNIKK